MTAYIQNWRLAHVKLSHEIFFRPSRGINFFLVRKEYKGNEAKNYLIKPVMIYGLMSVSPIQIPGINLILYICQTLVEAVSEDDITLLFEGLHIVYHLICEELASVF